MANRKNRVPMDCETKQVAKRLERAFREVALIARMGGDEFASLLRAPLGMARIARLLSRASSLLCQPLVWHDTRLEVGAPIGAALLEASPGRTTADLFERAEAARYAAKTAGGIGVPPLIGPRFSFIVTSRLQSDP